MRNEGEEALLRLLWSEGHFRVRQKYINGSYDATRKKAYGPSD